MSYVSLALLISQYRYTSGAEQLSADAHIYSLHKITSSIFCSFVSYLPKPLYLLFEQYYDIYTLCLSQIVRALNK